MTEHFRIKPPGKAWGPWKLGNFTIRPGYEAQIRISTEAKSIPVATFIVRKQKSPGGAGA